MPNKSRRDGANASVVAVASTSATAHVSGSATRLPPSIYVIGVVSMLNDIATEMVTPLIPILLATVLASGPLVLGLVEGLANAVACAVQIVAGRFSDARGGRRKPFAVTGYLVSNIVRPLLGFASAWPHVVLIRALDRVGKGIRNAPRDALIVDLAPADKRVGHSVFIARSTILVPLAARCWALL